MGILSRFGEIMSANINALLERAESKNAEKLLDEYLRQAQRDLGQLRSEAAAAAAAEKAARRELEDLDASIEKYGRYARAAVQDGEDAEARKFLTYQQELKEKRAAAAAQAAELAENSRKRKELTQKLNGDMDLIAARLQGLKGQVAVVRQQERMNQMNAAGGALSQLGKIERSLQQRQDRADAEAELQQGIDGGLEALCRKYENAPAAPPTGEIDPIEAALQKLKEEAGGQTPS